MFQKNNDDEIIYVDKDNAITKIFQCDVIWVWDEYITLMRDIKVISNIFISKETKTDTGSFHHTTSDRIEGASRVNINSYIKLCKPQSYAVNNDNIPMLNQEFLIKFYFHRNHDNEEIKQVTETNF